MNNFQNDPIGSAILEYSKNGKPTDIVVISDICDDDIIPTEVLFRTFDEMPDIEREAIKQATGKVLDVGAAAGVHSLELQKRGLDVLAIDLSEGAVNYMKSKGLRAEQVDFYQLKGEHEQFDTILMMMNGIGIAGTLSNLEKTLLHAKSLLMDGGCILCDSSDIKYLYEDEDGSLWVDLNSDYYGNFRFQMMYKKAKSDWFDWLYVDFDNLYKAAANLGMKAVRIMESNDHYLAKIRTV